MLLDLGHVCVLLRSEETERNRKEGGQRERERGRELGKGREKEEGGRENDKTDGRKK